MSVHALVELVLLHGNTLHYSGQCDLMCFDTCRSGCETGRVTPMNA